jgi:ribosomal protein S18 acetylase RimI-like enzyme
MVQVLFSRIWRGLTMYKNYIFYAQPELDHTAALPRGMAVVRRSSLEELAPAEIRWLIDFTDEDTVRTSFVKRFRMGACIHIATVDDAFAGFFWIIRRRPMEEHFFFPFTESDAYMFDVAVDPALRGRGIGSRIMHDGLCSLKGSGVQRLYLCVNQWNKPSLKMVSKAPFQLFGVGKVFHIFGLDLVVWFSMAHRDAIRASERPA